MSRKSILGLAALLAIGALASALWFLGRGKSTADTVETPAGRPGRPVENFEDPAAIPAMLRDSSWRTRMAAANALRTMSALSVPQRAALLAQAIEAESAAPTSGPRFAGSYLPLTSVLRLQYLGLLEDFGAEATEAVARADRPATSAGREWRALALGATGEKASAPQLRELLASSDPAVRMTAARYLGYLQDREAVPVLRRALTDTFTSTNVNDTPGKAPATFYPVREQAARALRTLGLKVERRGHAFTAQ